LRQRKLPHAATVCLGPDSVLLLICQSLTEDKFFGKQCLEDMCADITNERVPVCAGVPCELVRHWDPAQPLLVGGLAASEEGRGFLQLRLKRHR
jgi:hypothetical protein